MFLKDINEMEIIENLAKEEALEEVVKVYNLADDIISEYTKRIIEEFDSRVFVSFMASLNLNLTLLQKISSCTARIENQFLAIDKELDIDFKLKGFIEEFIDANEEYIASILLSKNNISKLARIVAELLIDLSHYMSVIKNRINCEREEIEKVLEAVR